MHGARYKRITPTGYQAFIHEGVKTPLQSPLRGFGDEAHKAGEGGFRDLTAETWNQKMDMHVDPGWTGKILWGFLSENEMIILSAPSCNSMAVQDLESFLAKVESNPDLQDQLSQLDLQGVLQLAAKEGHQVRAADLLRAQAQQILAMSDDELDRLVEGGLDDLFDMHDFQAYLDRG
tara:strand:+ start:1750 stop:2280 length:531 start_codon:yes stop_codon:yes gene_type:complete